MRPEIQKGLITVLEGQYKDLGKVIKKEAEELIKNCEHPEKVWCDYEGTDYPMSPIIKCTTCRKEWHTWDGCWGDGPGKKISRVELYRLRYPVMVEGEVR